MGYPCEDITRNEKIEKGKLKGDTNDVYRTLQISIAFNTFQLGIYTNFMNTQQAPEQQPDRYPKAFDIKEFFREHKKTVLIGGGICVALVLIAAIIVSLRSTREQPVDQPEVAYTQEPQEMQSVELPSAGETDIFTGQQPTGTPFPLQGTAAPKKTTKARPTGEENLAVIVKFARGDKFNISIEDIRRTGGRITSDLYRPAPGSPYSIIRIAGADGSTIIEEKFIMATQISGDVIGMTAGTAPLENSTARLVFPISGRSTPTNVTLFTPQGATIASRAFDYATLPADPTALPLSSDESLLRSLGPPLIKPAQAQNVDGVLKIVVINEMKDGKDQNGNPVAEDQWPGGTNIPALLNQVKTEAELMKETIEPWRTFKSQVEVVTQYNPDKDLRCYVVRARDSSFPGCPDDAMVIDAVENIYGITDWDAVVVVYPLDCNCGAVKAVLPAPHIVGVGMRANHELLAHDFGHAIGDMGDEYGYLYGNTVALGVANCFANEQACLAAIQGLPPDAQCSFGCETVSTWRPSTRIMHNNYDPLQYGPLEECILGEKIGEILGSTYPCPRRNVDEPGPYWGWHR